MALTPPSDAIFPKNRIRKVTVLYDGTQPPYLEFSIAKLELIDGTTAIGIRHDRNEWNENTEENGYPVVRGGRPSWFIMPPMDNLLPILNQLFHKEKHSLTYSPTTISINDRNYTLSYPLLSSFEKEGENYVIKNPMLDIYATGKSEEDAEIDFNEEFDYLYKRLNSLQDENMNKHFKTIKLFINNIVKNVS
jgi:hypothetical protein